MSDTLKGQDPTPLICKLLDCLHRPQPKNQHVVRIKEEDYLAFAKACVELEELTGFKIQGLPATRHPCKECGSRQPAVEGKCVHCEAPHR